MTFSSARSIQPIYRNELSEWEFDKLCQCRGSLAETMLLQRARVANTKPSYVEDGVVEAGLLEYIGINARGLYYIQRGYCNFTAYFEILNDQIDFLNMVEKHATNYQ
mgnify:CR=1 FL=1